MAATAQFINACRRSRGLSDVQTERQNEDKRWFKWVVWVRIQAVLKANGFQLSTSKVYLNVAYNTCYSVWPVIFLWSQPCFSLYRVNVARNDLPWEFMVDHVPSILLFPRYRWGNTERCTHVAKEVWGGMHEFHQNIFHPCVHHFLFSLRKHHSVKFPDDLPITLPNLLRFILQHSGSVHHAHKPSVKGEGPGHSAVLQSEFLTLQHEVQALHHARERLSQQLAQLWRDNQRLKFDARSLEAANADLQRERQSLEEQHREKSRQLGEAVRRLQELADTSENLLNENMLLRVLLRALKDRTEAGEQPEEERKEAKQKRSHMASWAQVRRDPWEWGKAEKEKGIQARKWRKGWPSWGKSCD